MSDNADDFNLTSYERCKQFHHELNSFLCARSEEWDLNKYELFGVIATELVKQLIEEYDDDEDINNDEDS